MNSPVARFVAQLLVPGGLLLGAAGLLLYFRLTPEPALRVLALVVCAAGAVLAWRFHSSRVFLAMGFLAIAAWSLGPDARWLFGPDRQAVLSLVSLLVPLNLCFLALMEDSSVALDVSGWWAAFTLVEFAVVALLGREAGQLVAKLYRPEAVWLAHLPAAALFLSGIGAAGLMMRFAITRNSLDIGFFWALTACFLGLAAQGRSAGFFAAAAAILVASVVENSYAMAYRDELTGLPGRRAFNRALTELGDRYTVAVVDIDHFKKFNDSYGHDTGDEVLRMVASRLSKVTGGGKAFRCGGEEFAIVFPQFGLRDALPHLEELRSAVADTPFTVRGPDRSRRQRQERRERHDRRRRRGAKFDATVTISIGAAEPSTAMAEPEDVVESADRALYLAKDRGRNRVEAAASPRIVRSRRTAAPARMS